MTQFVAQKEGFEPSRAFYTPTPLAGEPLRPLGYFSKPNSISNMDARPARCIIVAYSAADVNLFFG